MTVILALADLIFAKKCQHRYAHNVCFREWYQDSRNSQNLNPTKIMSYTVCVNINFILLTKFCALFLTNI